MDATTTSDDLLATTTRRVHPVALMGVVNLNPDSFSSAPTERGSPTRPEDPIDDAMALVAAGADLVDLGAESASKLAPRVPVERQLEILLPVVAALRDHVRVSVDTYHASIAAAVAEAGAAVVNDYSGLADPAMLEVVRDTGTALVLTHNIAPVKERLNRADLYTDVVAEVGDWFAARLATIAAAGVDPDRVLLDPGIDLSKTPAQSVAVLRGLDRLRARFTNPLLVAISRKDVLGTIHPVPPHRRDPGTLAALHTLTTVPGTVARVHDVAGARQYLDVLDHLVGDAVLPEDAAIDDRLRRSST